MSHEDFLLEAYCLVDTLLHDVIPGGRLRQRGPAPRLSDAEAITIAIAGEFFELDADTAIYAHFRRHHLAEFPALARIGRSTFARQAANLWRVVQRLAERLRDHFAWADPVLGTPQWLIDSFPLRVSRLKRAPACKRFRGQAAHGYDPTGGRDGFYGFRVHVRCAAGGPCAQIGLAPANVPDLAMVEEVMAAEGGEALADRNYWSPQLRKELARRGTALLAPFKRASGDPKPLHSGILARLRQYIEPLIGQLATRFHMETTRARDLWHLTARLSRKWLGHSVAVLLTLRGGHPPLQLARLIDA